MWFFPEIYKVSFENFLKENILYIFNNPKKKGELLIVVLGNTLGRSYQ